MSRVSDQKRTIILHYKAIRYQFVLFKVGTAHLLFRLSQGVPLKAATLGTLSQRYNFFFVIAIQLTAALKH